MHCRFMTLTGQKLSLLSIWLPTGELRARARAWTAKGCRGGARSSPLTRLESNPEASIVTLWLLHRGPASLALLTLGYPRKHVSNKGDRGADTALRPGTGKDQNRGRGLSGGTCQPLVCAVEAWDRRG